MEYSLSNLNLLSEHGLTMVALLWLLDLQEVDAASEIYVALEARIERDLEYGLRRPK